MTNAHISRRQKVRRPSAPARKMGNWKLAYADFLTALCAFFLVMWVVNGVSAEDKVELAQQFSSDSEQTFETASAPEPDMAADLADQLRADPGLLAFGPSVSVTAEDNLVRIDLTDMATRPLFDTGDGALNETGRGLTQAVGRAIAYLSVPIRIEGHTDANPNLTPGYSNWELSADRANSARRIIEEAGVKSARIRGVTGLADTRPLFPETPLSAANRRISIVLVIMEQSA